MTSSQKGEGYRAGPDDAALHLCLRHRPMPRADASKTFEVRRRWVAKRGWNEFQLRSQSVSGGTELPADEYRDRGGASSPKRGWPARPAKFQKPGQYLSPICCVCSYVSRGVPPLWSLCTTFKSVCPQGEDAATEAP